MMRMMKSILVGLAVLMPAVAVGDVTPEAAQKLYEKVTPSLVPVQYVWQNELSRVDLTGAGIIVREDGLVMVSMSMFPMQVPDAQMKEFKILIPREDGEPKELEAVFQGRDQRTNMVFLKTKEEQNWKPLKFEDGEVKIGQPVLSVGMLPKDANYKPYFAEGQVAATLRGDTPQVLVMGGGLAAVGSPVFDADGKAIGIVAPSATQSPLLNDTNPRDPLSMVTRPPKVYIPARDFLKGIADPPTPDKPIKLPWLGVAQMTGLNKDVAEVYGLGNQPAVQIGDVIAGGPADKAGLKPEDIIVKVDGKPLERGDQPMELPMILSRRLMWMKPDSVVTLSVLREKDQPLKQVEVKLGEQPKQPNLAKRWYASDVGFAVRELVFSDIYAMKLPQDQKGVLVALLKPQGAAQSGGLKMGDVITKLNNEPITDVDQFEKTYKALRKEKPREALVMEVHRGDREDTVRIEPPQ
jgi:serine protease Do